MTDAPENLTAWLRAEIDAIMGAAGADYSEEPVTVYMRCADRIEALEAKIAALDPDNYEAQVQRWVRGTAILRGEKP